MNKLIFLLLVVLITGCAETDPLWRQKKQAAQIKFCQDLDLKPEILYNWSGELVRINCLPNELPEASEVDGCAPGHAEDYNGDCMPIHPPASPYLSN